MLPQELQALRQRSGINCNAELFVPSYKPVWFLKPDSAMLLKGQPFFYPSFSHRVEYEAEVVVRIDKVGKGIEPRWAHRYYSQVALGIDFTARDLQLQAKAQGLPWTQSKGFDGSAVISDLIPLETLGGDIQNINFILSKNGNEVQHGNTRDMLTSVDDTISYISRYMLLRTGDLIYTGTPSGVGTVEIGDVLTGTLQGMPVLSCKIK